VDNVSVIIIKDVLQVIPAPAHNHIIDKVRLPHLIDSSGLVCEIIGCFYQFMLLGGDQDFLLEDPVYTGFRGEDAGFVGYLASQLRLD
jgi:hypothetical protein